jgi:hypothetical protein
VYAPGCFVTLFRFGQEIAIRWTRIDTRQYRLVSLKYFIQQPHLNGLKILGTIDLGGLI